jgi:hypothetical protein
MTQRLVMLDANLIISAFDDEAERTPEIRDEAKKAVMALMNDPAVKFVTTPIISYEVLCNARTFENEQKLKRLLNGYKLYEIGDSVANCAVEIFKISRANHAKFKDPNEPSKYKFDIFHVATAKVNEIELESRDTRVNAMNQLNVGK